MHTVMLSTSCLRSRNTVLLSDFIFWPVLMITRLLCI